MDLKQILLNSWAENMFFAILNIAVTCFEFDSISWSLFKFGQQQKKVWKTLFLALYKEDTQVKSGILSICDVLQHLQNRSS